MASKTSDAMPRIKKFGELGNGYLGSLASRINQLKKHIQAIRCASIKEKNEVNRKNLAMRTAQFFFSVSTQEHLSMEHAKKTNMLSFRISGAPCVLSGSNPELEDKENVTCQEEGLSSAVIVQGIVGEKCVINAIKLPYVERISPYTTWIFLDRNQRMAEDQSIVGRRRIYYDPCGSEALICSDSDEEMVEPTEEKHDFSAGEDQILWEILQEYEPSPEVLNVLSHFLGASSSELQDRYQIIMERQKNKKIEDSEGPWEAESDTIMHLDRTLSTALDSFDNLFCRRCLVFDCRLHDCSQNLIFPIEKQLTGCELEVSGKPCSDQCFLWARKWDNNLFYSNPTVKHGRDDIFATEKDACQADEMTTPEKTKECRTAEAGCLPFRISKHSDELSTQSARKKFKMGSGQVTPEVTAGVIENAADGDPGYANDMTKSFLPKGQVKEDAAGYEWNPIEKELYAKGIEIFGRNSCLIARNLLPGLRTCVEIFNYMLNAGGASPNRTSSLTGLNMDDDRSDDMEQKIHPTMRNLRRRGRARKLKYTLKSPGSLSIRKRIIDGKQQQCKQYTPCGCQSICWRECSCVQNGTCCEKYCGCPKSCKNRFRGCHCAKSQCRSRHCPCFAAGRECDPDVCRNCWVSCGDGSVGEPPLRGDGYQCGNMKLLLKQRQRILLGKSDVAGWGAFIKNPVSKNDYLGEYTGELISHREADKRGKIYDRANSSFLFDLNDQYVLDAYRKGDKLKFANHSSNPNCYAKVMLVAGDHRVGIFAKEHIEASEELFYDYRYGPDQAPAWARKPYSLKRDDTFHCGRAHKAVR